MRSEADRQYAAEDWPGAILYYNETFRAADAAARRFRAVHAYWFFTETRDNQRRTWRTAMRNYSFEDPHAAKIADRERLLKDLVLTGDFLAAERDAIEPIHQLFAQSVQMLRDEAGEPVLNPDPLRRAAKPRCEVDVPVDTGGAGPEPFVPPKIVAGRSRSGDDFYPRDAVLFGMLGRTTARVLVSELGCVDWAEVLISSGHWRLDEAALSFAVRGAIFRPAQRGGRPVPATTHYTHRFSIPQP